MSVRSLVLSSFALVGLVALAGCSKSSTADTSASPTTSEAPAKKAEDKSEKKEAKAKVIKIEKLGLKGDAPGETEDPIIGDGDPILVMAAGFTVNVAAAKPTDPKKIKDGEDAAGIFNPQNMKSETLSDGWALTFENTGSAGKNYFISVRREIGGTGYLCETAQTTPEQQKAALAFCKSLSSAK